MTISFPFLYFHENKAAKSRILTYGCKVIIFSQMRSTKTYKICQWKVSYLLVCGSMDFSVLIGMKISSTMHSFLLIVFINL